MDCAFPLLLGIETSDDARQGVRRRQLRAARRVASAHEGHGAQGSARGQRRDLHRPGQGARRERGRRRARAGGRQPREHELPHRDEQRGLDPAGALHRDDASRPQPGQGAARGEDRTTGRGGHEHDDLGQPLGHAVSRRVQRQGRRQDRERPRRPGLDRERLHPDRATAGRRGARGARRVVGGVGRVGRARPRARLGARYRRRATGPAWRCAPTAPTECPRD